MLLFPKGSIYWNHSLASPSRVRQNLWTFTSSLKLWAFTQSLECSKCASASSSGFPENSGLKFDQFIWICHCPAASWFGCCSNCWFCLCLWLGATAPSSLFAIFLTYIYNFFCSYLYLSDPYMLHFLLCGFSRFLPFYPSRHDKLTVVYLLFSKFNSSQILEFDDSWKLIITMILSGIIPDKKPFTNFLSSVLPQAVVTLLTSLSLFSTIVGSLLCIFDILDPVQ